MTTVRLVIVLLIGGTVVLLAVQNTSPALPLVFLGLQSVALPLAIWMVLAIALGALTTLALTVLLNTGKRNTRNKSYKYRPQPFYEPADTRAAARDVAEEADGDRSSYRGAAWPGQRAQPRQSQTSETADYGSTWQDWTNLQSSDSLQDWESLDRAAQAGQSSSRGPRRSTAGSGIGSWLFGNRQAAEQDQVDQSWQELSDDWGDLENRRHQAQGVSPVDDSLEDINQGWEQDQYGRSPADFEAAQSPKRVYQDGSLYSYSYRNRGHDGQRDNIYAPPDDVVYGDDEFDRDAYIDLSEADGYENRADQPLEAPDPNRAEYGTEDLGEPEIAEDGVVDADYRVLVPPAPAADSASPEAEATTGEQSWDQRGKDDDDWNEAEDALTP